MADNYLERRMEDLRAGRIASGSARPTRTSPSAQRRGQLAGIRAIVTGGAGLIGSEIVKALRAEGAKVDILDTDRPRGAALAQQCGACFRPVDISDPEALARCFSEITAARGDVDVIVNCAACVDFTPLADNDATRFMRSMAVNVLPAFETARLLAIHRAALPSPNPYGGRIINICSTRARQSEPGTENYSASKGALMSLTHSLMMSLSPFGITVNSVSPGWIAPPDEPHTEADCLQHPSRRVGIPADIARACVYICHPANAFLNGIDIPVDGGITHRMIYV